MPLILDIQTGTFRDRRVVNASLAYLDMSPDPGIDVDQVAGEEECEHEDAVLQSRCLPGGEDPETQGQATNEFQKYRERPGPSQRGQFQEIETKDNESEKKKREEGNIINQWRKNADHDDRKSGGVSNEAPLAHSVVPDPERMIKEILAQRMMRQHQCPIQPISSLTHP